MGLKWSLEGTPSTSVHAACFAKTNPSDPFRQSRSIPGRVGDVMNIPGKTIAILDTQRQICRISDFPYFHTDLGNLPHRASIAA